MMPAEELRRRAVDVAARDRRLRNGWLVALLIDVGLLAAMVATGAPAAAYVAVVVFTVVTLGLVIGKTFAIRDADAEAELYGRVGR